MCGIVAVVSNQGRIAPGALAQAIEALSHRGPDDRTEWFDPQQNAALGHTRLSVIDLAGGAQPIANEDGTLRIVANGEFYDFEGIRAELESRGHRFRTRSDSEIAVHLYEERGVRCLDCLRGEFAFIIWDQTKRTLFAARDRFGIKPLFYSMVGHTLYVASEVRALFAAGVPSAWNAQALYKTLFFCPDRAQTLFEGIRQVPPGHYVLAGERSFQLVQYWDLDYPVVKDQVQHRNDGEILEELRLLLDDAVRIRMRADVPVGCYLSGGIDSSSVLALGFRHRRDTMTAFTVAFSDPDFDESAAARRQSEFTGAAFERVEVTETDVASRFPDVVGQGEMVHYNAHGVARWLLSRSVRRAGYKVVLSGEGADELFLGYDFLTPTIANPVRPGWIPSWTRLFRLLRPKTRSETVIAEVSPWLSRTCRLFALQPPISESLSEKFTMLRSIMAPDFLHQAESRDIYRDFIGQFNFRETLKGRENSKQLLYLWAKSMFVNYVLAAERLDMAHGVEVRLPFLDHKLFEFVRSIPSAWHHRDGIRKHLLREAVKPWVKHETYCRKKQPFFAPASTLRPRSPLYQELQDLLRSQPFTSMPFFNRQSVIAVLDKLPELGDDHRASIDPVVFALASLAVLRVRYKV